jgi:hypothetical protein
MGGSVTSRLVTNRLSHMAPTIGDICSVEFRQRSMIV